MSTVTLSLLLSLLFVGGEKATKKKGEFQLQLHQFSVQRLVTPFLNQIDPNAPINEACFGLADPNIPNGGSRFGLMEGRAVKPCGEIDSILELLRVALGKEAFQGRKARMWIQGGKLTFIGEPELAKKANSFLKRMKGIIAPRIRISCRLVSEGKGRSFGLIDDKEVSKLPLVLEWRERGRAGDRIFFGVLGEKRYQGKMDAEVANESTILDPRIHPIAMGKTVSLMALPAKDGGFGVVGYFLDRGFSAEISSKDLAGKELGTIEFSKQDILKRAFSCMVKPGSQVYVPLGGEKELALVLRVEMQDSLPKGQDTLLRSLSLYSIPFGAYTSSLFSPLFPSDLSEVSSENVGSDLPGWMNAYLDPDKLVDLLFSTLGREGLTINLFGGNESPSLFVSGANEAGKKAGQILDLLTKDLGRSFLVDVQMQVMPMGHSDTGWRDYRRVANLPCLSNRSILVEDVKELGYLKDYDVEIAQKSSIGNPIPGKVAMGNRLRAYLAADGERVHVFLSLGQQAFLGFRRIPPACDKLGPLMGPELRKVTFQRFFSMKVGETVLLGEGLKTEVEGLGECRTRYAMTIRELRFE
ncbi:MAG TPA: hypothetical protein ENK02_13670 [Planctomycetes bacterium]|nr:hypothetical protein [Planctomycetota bacterium]